MTTREAVLANPGVPGLELARMLGVKKQWVSEIRLEAGQRTRRTHVKGARVLLVCSACGLQRVVKPSDARKKKVGLCIGCFRRSRRPLGAKNKPKKEVERG